MTKLIIFDLDGTLAESKQPLTNDMSALVAQLLVHTRVAVISGGALPQFLKQMVSSLPSGANLANLYLLPTSGAALYEYHSGEWKKIYEERLSEKEASTIKTAMLTASTKTGIIDFSESSYGERIEYRGGQVTLSALGQEAPIAKKKAWDADHAKRYALRMVIAELLPEFSVNIGGATSVDVTKRNIDKAYGLHKLCERLSINESSVLYIGDELGPGGNDESVYKTNVQTKNVTSPAETAEVIEKILSSR